MYIYIYIYIYIYACKRLCQADFYGLKSLYGFIGGPTVQAAMMLETPTVQRSSGTVKGLGGASTQSIDGMTMWLNQHKPT